MKYHAYISKAIDKNDVPLYYSYCGTSGTSAKKFFFSPDMFQQHYAHELACKKCSVIVSKMFLKKEQGGK